MRSSSHLMDAFREAMTGNSPVIWGGAGITAALSGGSPLATWRGVVEFAVQRSVDLGLFSEERAASLRRKAAAPVSSLLSVCNVVETTLRRAGEWEQVWFDFNRALQVRDEALGHALAALNAPIVTTNYDSLLERVIGRRSVTWQHPEQIERVMSGRATEIVHVHGVHDQPDTIVFSGRGYCTYCAKVRVRATLDALQILRTQVFVGFGDGLRDPFFREYFNRLRATIPSSSIRHFRLCTESEAEALRDFHRRDRIIVVPYGRSYDSLPAFLERLAPPPVRTRRSPAVYGSAAASLAFVALLSGHMSSPVAVIVTGRVLVGARPAPGVVLDVPGSAPIQADAHGQFRAVVPRSPAPPIVTATYGSRTLPIPLPLPANVREASVDLELVTHTATVTRSK